MANPADCTTPESGVRAVVRPEHEWQAEWEALRRTIVMRSIAAFDAEQATADEVWRKRTSYIDTRKTDDVGEEALSYLHQQVHLDEGWHVRKCDINRVMADRMATVERENRFPVNISRKRYRRRVRYAVEAVLRFGPELTRCPLADAGDHLCTVRRQSWNWHPERLRVVESRRTDVPAKLVADDVTMFFEPAAKTLVRVQAVALGGAVDFSGLPEWCRAAGRRALKEGTGKRGGRGKKTYRTLICDDLNAERVRLGLEPFGRRQFDAGVKSSVLSCAATYESARGHECSPFLRS